MTSPTPADGATSRVLLHSAGRYGLAVLVVAAATSARWVLPDVLGQTPYLAFYPAVVAAAAFGGLGPGLLATVLSFLCVDVLFTPPIGEFSHDPLEWARQAVFFAGGAGTSLLSGMLRESLRKYRAVAEHTHDWEFWVAPDGRFRYVSPSCLNVTGFPAQAFLDDPQLAERIVHPDDLAHYHEHRGHGHDACATPEVEFRIIHQDGTVRWIGHACVPIFDEAGIFLGIRGSNRDITQRKLAEKALAESQAKLAGIITSAMDAIVTIDENQQVLLFNPAAERMFGLPAKEAIGGPIERFLPDRFRAAHAGHIRRFGQTGETSRAMGHLGAISGLRASGEEFPIEASISQVAVEGRKLFSVILRDITERKAADEALRQSEERFRALVTAGSETLYRISPDWSEMRQLRGGGSLLDTEAPRRSWLQDYILAEDQSRVLGVINEAIRTRSTFELEHRVRRPDGTVGWTFSRAIPLLDAGGEIVDWFGASSDVTDRKEAEEALVAAKLSAERAKADAEKASRTKDHFMAVLSHELRNPLTPVLATASLLQEDPRLDEEFRGHLEVIRRNAELEARLIDDLLDVTRISRGKVELDRRPVELSTILRHAVEVCQPDIAARHLHFGLDIKDPPHIVHADPGRLQQVFWNILKNAVKFTPHDGCVGLRCWRADDHVLVEVSDSGVGIDPEALTRIFNAFEQAESSTTRQFGGLGLGLAISKALVEMQDGTITAHSEGKGKGARFTVRLPLASSPAAASGVIPPPHAVGNGLPAIPLRILLVEDHGDTAHIMTQLLIRQGHQVHAAGDVATALELAASHRFDLLLSDLGLPDGSGLDLMRALRARGSIFPAIALSGYGQEQDIRQSLEAGFSLHMTKPVDVPRLTEAVATLAGRGLRAAEASKPWLRPGTARA